MNESLLLLNFQHHAVTHNKRKKQIIRKLFFSIDQLFCTEQTFQSISLCKLTTIDEFSTSDEDSSPV